jgi:phytoene dehydrogenase-like protein
MVRKTIGDKMQNRSIIIIGAGFAGLCAGIYAQQNGYHTQILEMHDLPGGLCTAWKRRGYTIDGCIHWLVGSSPKSPYYRWWEEVGLVQDREFINLEEFARFEGDDGRTFIIYSDVDHLEKHMLELSPQDKLVIKDFINGIHFGIRMDQPGPSDSWLTKTIKGLKISLLFATKGKDFNRWMNTTAEDFANRFQDSLIRTALKEMWFPEFSIFFMLFTLAYLHTKNAGYPLGGSMPMSKALEKRYLSLGGKIHYQSKVEQILVEDNRAVGVRLIDGREFLAERVISAADGHTTIFKMLNGKYADEKVREPYDKWPIFPPLILVGLGINRSFEDHPKTVSGISFPLRQPVEIAGEIHQSLSVRILNHDHSLAPAGKTSAVVMLNSNYAYWKELADDRAAYDEKKEQIARTIVELLEQRFPGIGSQVEMVDVATPLTFERFTGNWQGSFEGWLITPQNAHTIMKPMGQTLPGLRNFYMCGQWVEPGGGLPTGLLSGRRLIQAICKEDGNKFEAKVT